MRWATLWRRSLGLCARRLGAQCMDWFLPACGRSTLLCDRAQITASRSVVSHTVGYFCVSDDQFIHRHRVCTALTNLKNRVHTFPFYQFVPFLSSSLLWRIDRHHARILTYKGKTMYHFCMLVFSEIETNVQATVGTPISAPRSKKCKAR